MSIRLTLLGSSSDALAAMSNDLPLGDSSIEVSTLLGSAADALNELQAGRADMLVANVANLTGSDFDLLESVIQARPQSVVILVSSNHSPEFLLRAMRSGVREVVPLPLANGELRSALTRQIDRISSTRGPEQRGKVIAFLPAKGGSGSTFLATNLAFALAATSKRVAVIDLNLQFGDAHLFLSETMPPSTISEVSRQIQRLDAAFLESSMLSVAQNLWILAAPSSPERAVDVKPEAAEKIVALARSRYDFVILDVGRILEAVSVRALDMADAVYIVLQQTLPFLHDARRLMGVLQGLGYPQDKLNLVLNRADKGSEIGDADIQKAVGLPVKVRIPNSYANVAYSVNHGIAILKHAARDPVSKALHEFAAQLVPTEKPRAGGWFRGVGSFIG